MSLQDRDVRLDRVEGEVGEIRGDVSGIKEEMGRLTGDVRALGGILTRIEAGVTRAQERSEQKEYAGRPNLVAIVSVLITIISIIVGGAWMVSGALSRQEERAIAQEKMNALFQGMRNREADVQNADIRRLEDRTYQHRGAVGVP